MKLLDLVYYTSLDDYHTLSYEAYSVADILSYGAYSVAGIGMPAKPPCISEQYPIFGHADNLITVNPVKPTPYVLLAVSPP